MTDKEIQSPDFTYEDIETLTKKQTNRVIIAIFGVIVISFLYTNIPRVINTNFYDINDNGVDYMYIIYTEYSKNLGYNVNNFEIYYNDDDNYDLNEILTVISEYDYQVRPKTFAGIQTLYDFGGNAHLSVDVIYTDNENKHFKLCGNGDVWVDMIAYKMDSDEATTLMSEIINWSGIDEIDESEYEPRFSG